MECRAWRAGRSDLKLVAHQRQEQSVALLRPTRTRRAVSCSGKRIYCHICMAQIAYSGNTSNLSYHLEKNHPDEFCPSSSKQPGTDARGLRQRLLKLKRTHAQPASAEHGIRPRAGHERAAAGAPGAVMGLIEASTRPPSSRGPRSERC